MKNFLTILLLIITPIHLYADCTSESGAGRIECMDFDGASPPANWPESDGVPWQDWQPMPQYACDPPASCDGGDSALVTNQRVGSTGRALRVTRNAGMFDVVDLQYTFTEITTAIYTRMYLYFPSSSWSVAAKPFVQDEYIHLTFMSTMVVGSHVGIDINSHLDGSLAAPTCSKAGNVGLLPSLRISDHEVSCGGDGDPTYLGPQADGGSWSPMWVEGCWDFRDNLDRWIVMETMFDPVNERTRMWIDGTLMYDREACSTYMDSFDAFYMSGWSSPAPNNVQEVTFYVDNIVIDDEYIGPMGGAPSSPVTINAGGTCSHR